MPQCHGSIAGDVARLRRERPHVRVFVEPFLGLLLARGPLVERLCQETVYQPVPHFDPVRFGLGACLEPRENLVLDPAALRRCYAALQPILTAGFREVRPDVLALGRLAARQEDFIPAVVRDLLADRPQALTARAGICGVASHVLGFWALQMVMPLALARGRVLSHMVSLRPWNRGYCPVCGSWPSFLRREARGGWLTCSFCATTWRFTLRECPFCGATGPPARVYAIPEFEAERVVVCRRCNHYLAELADGALADYSPEVAQLALAPLERIARECGHVPARWDWRQMVWD